MAKTILITGSTDGIGLLTAQKLAGQGHHVLLHGRNAQKLKDAAAQVPGCAGRYQADLSSLAQTRDLAEAVKSDHAQVDVLINNAGVYKMPDPVLPSGQDARFVVNTVAPYLLAQMLLPLLPADGRVINLSSAAQAPVDLSALKGGVPLDHMAAYAQSKRAIALWTQVMAERHPQGPAFIAVNPGSLLASKMVKEGFGVAGHDLSIGADILCRLSLDPDHAGDSGRYWDNDARRFSPVAAQDLAGLMAVLDGQAQG